MDGLEVNFHDWDGQIFRHQGRRITSTSAIVIEFDPRIFKRGSINGEFESTLRQEVESRTQQLINEIRKRDYYGTSQKSQKSEEASSKEASSSNQC